MLVSIALALMTGAAVLAVLLPLSRKADGRLGRRPARRPTGPSTTAQIADIDRDAERGLLEPVEAETVRGWRRRAACSPRTASREVGPS